MRISRKTEGKKDQHLLLFSGRSIILKKTSWLDLEKIVITELEEEFSSNSNNRILGTERRYVGWMCGFLPSFFLGPQIQLVVGREIGNLSLFRNRVVTKKVSLGSRRGSIRKERRKEERALLPD